MPDASPTLPPKTECEKWKLVERAGRSCGRCCQQTNHYSKAADSEIEAGRALVQVYNHCRNRSLLKKEKSVRLAPFYDFVPMKFGQAKARRN